MFMVRSAVNATRGSDFRLLLAAIGVSAVGSRVTRTALPMAAILVLDATPLQLGWLGVLGVLPGALVAWWAGAWIDRRSKRAVLVGADWVRALLIASIPLAAIQGSLTLIHLGIVAALVCMATVLFEIADHAFLPVIVPSGQLIDANSKLETVDSLAEITGPPLGGMLVQWLTAPFALVIDAFSFVASALLISRLRVSETVAESNVGAHPNARMLLLREARDGALLVWGIRCCDRCS
jgi:Transmembrane secretion effector